MRAILSLLVFVCLFAVLTAYSQSSLSVDEGNVSAVLRETQLVIDLPMQSRSRVRSVDIRLEILDENDKLIAAGDLKQALNAGSQVAQIPLTLAQMNLDKILWYRLRYSVSQPDSPNVVANTVALSEIMPEIFELQVTAPENVFAGMNVRAHVLAIHPYTKKPVRNVDISGTVELDLDTEDDNDELNLNVKTRTDADGIATLDFKIPADARLDDGEIIIEGSKNGIIRKADADLDVSADSFVYLYTDKPIYQPNQKLYIRGLYLNAVRRPVFNKELEIEIRDEEGKTVLEKTVTTSRFGIANIEWQIPADFQLGKYSIRVANDDSDDIGSAVFKVSRYDLPNFTVNARPDKPYYLTSETAAEISVDATYLFGKPVQGGKVKIVEEKERTWNFIEQEYDTDEGPFYEGVTGADGRFTAKDCLTEAAAAL